MTSIILDSNISKRQIIFKGVNSVEIFHFVKLLVNYYKSFVQLLYSIWCMFSWFQQNKVSLSLLWYERICFSLILHCCRRWWLNIGEYSCIEEDNHSLTDCDLILEINHKHISANESLTHTTTERQFDKQ